MNALPILLLTIAINTAHCSPPVGGQPHYIIPDALRDVIYHNQLALDAYAPVGEPRPAAVIIHGSQGNKSTHVTQLFEVLAHAGFAFGAVPLRLGWQFRMLDWAETAGNSPDLHPP